MREAEPGERLEDELAAVAALESVVRAWVCRASPDSLREAVAGASGPLAGWTFGVKDVIDTAELPTERGSSIHAGRRPSVDAACVALARNAGAVVAGKTVTTEFALFVAAETTNPHDPGRSPGGSSSGSAAAVAAGMCRAAFGTQTVGSVLRPAAYCGVVGFKPTYHLIPPTGVATLAQSLDTVGWFTRDVTDSGRILAALCDPAAATADVRSDVEPGTRSPIRVGYHRSAQWDQALPETVAALDWAAERLAADGVEVVELDDAAHLSPVFAAGDVTLLYESVRALAPERRTAPGDIHPLIMRMFEKASSVTPTAYGAARRAVAGARHTHDAWLEHRSLDAILTPAAPGEAPGPETTGDSVFNRVWSTLGVPAISLPVPPGPTGMPLGVQLTGRRWDDVALLAVAARAEAAFATDTTIRSRTPTGAP